MGSEAKRRRLCDQEVGAASIEVALAGGRLPTFAGQPGQGAGVGTRSGRPRDVRRHRD